MRDDAGELGFVTQDGNCATDLPLSQAQVVSATGVVAENAARITDRQRSDSLSHRPLNRGFGGLVLSRPNPSTMPALNAAGPAPSSGLMLTSLGSSSCGCFASLFGVRKVHAVFGADRSPGNEQRLSARSSHGVGMDDPQVYAGN
jgi:hypothetical protein